MFTRFLIHLLLGSSLLILGCQKKITRPGEPLPAIDESSYAQFRISGIEPGKAGLYAVLSLANVNGDSVISNRKVALTTYQQQYVTEPIKLNRENYVINKLIVVNSGDTALFAVPKMNSTKAGLVNIPLPFAIPLKTNGVNMLDATVTTVNTADQPQLYGYSSVDFGFEAHISAYVQLRIKVGTVWYDSLPALLQVHAVKENGEKWSREINIKGTINKITIPAGYKWYHFETNKWKSIQQENISGTYMKDSIVIKLESEKQPKLLKEEAIFIDNGIELIPESKTTYSYDSRGRISEARFYQRSIREPGLPLFMQDVFSYHSGNKWDSVLRYNNQQQLIGYTAVQRNSTGITSIFNKSFDQHIKVTVTYTEASGYKEITCNYRFDNSNAMQYKMIFRNGNNAEDYASSSTGSAEKSVYTYDAEINPYHQLGYDNLYFSHYSKNNIKGLIKEHTGAIPSVVPYRYEYSYDEDGYPKEVFISYKSYQTQNHSYRIKKTFQYQ